MRYPLSISLACCGALALAAACAQPEYPDDFDDSLEGAQGTSDAAVVVAVAPDAGLGSGPPPGSTQNPPSSVNPGRPDATVAVPFDAGVTMPPIVQPTDPGRRDSGLQEVDAGGGSEDAGGDPMAGSGPSSCMIKASTDASDAFPYTNKYGCAVWIANESNKVVKAFLVATRIATRSGLPTYRTAASGVTVDVVASATLGAARQHMYTWMLTNSSGAKVAPGKYTLNVETHSENGTYLVSVPFDTTQATVSAMGTPKGDINSASIDCQ